jgi:prevent-host-death family protein
MDKTLAATKAKNNFGELLRHVYTTGNRVIVEKDGIPVVIISPIGAADFRKNGPPKRMSRAQTEAKDVAESNS